MTLERALREAKFALQVTARAITMREPLPDPETLLLAAEQLNFFLPQRGAGA